METIQFEQILSFLEKNNIKFTNNQEDGKFNRNIIFNIYDQTFKIEWYVNESTLHIGLGNRSAQIAFKYIYLDTTCPCSPGGNKSIAFSYVKFEKKSLFDREYPYEVFRIPLELDNESK